MPMFPLGSVLVPGAYLPLHVFEERYQALVHDCLDGDGEFGVVLIERGSEVGGGDVRCRVGTVARIIEVSRFGDGRWALGAVGTRRIVVREWLADDPYPRADVEEWPDPPASAELGDTFDELVPRLRRVLALRAELGDAVSDATIAFSGDPVRASYQAVAVAPLGPADRQALLAAPDADVRLFELGELLADDEEFLARRLAMEAGTGGEAPPDVAG